MIVVTFRAGNGNEWELDLTNRRLRCAKHTLHAIIPAQLEDWAPYSQTGPIGLGRNEFEVQGWGLLGFVFMEFVGIRVDGDLVTADRPLTVADLSEDKVWGASDLDWDAEAARGLIVDPEVVRYRSGASGDWEVDLSNRRLRHVSWPSGPYEDDPLWPSGWDHQGIAPGSWIDYESTATPVGLGVNVFRTPQVPWRETYVTFRKKVDLPGPGPALAPLVPPTVADLTVRAASEVLAEVFDDNQWTWTGVGVPDADQLEEKLKDFVNRVLDDGLLSVSSGRLLVRDSDGVIDLALVVGTLIPGDFTTVV